MTLGDEDAWAGHGPEIRRGRGREGTRERRVRQWREWRRRWRGVESGDWGGGGGEHVVFGFACVRGRVSVLPQSL